jgi:hypothetical protein
MNTTTHTKLAVWIGRMGCYNEGRLIGDWLPAADSGAVTTYDVQGAHSRAGTHVELPLLKRQPNRKLMPGPRTSAVSSPTRK